VNIGPWPPSTTIASNRDNVDVSRFACVLHQRGQLRGGDEPHADQIFRRIAAGIARIAQGVWLAFAAFGAVYLDLISLFSEAEIRVRQLAPPETDRPASRRGYRTIGDDDGDAFSRLPIDNVRILQTH
jgi:hypothetical protein